MFVSPGKNALVFSEKVVLGNLKNRLPVFFIGMSVALSDELSVNIVCGYLVDSVHLKY